MNTLWYPADRKRDYQEIVLAWLEQLVNSPVCFPRYGFPPKAFIPEVLPLLDAWVMRPDAMLLLTDGDGSWLGLVGTNEVALCSGREAVAKALTIADTSWHTCDIHAMPKVRPWRLFTQCPERYTSPVATRRMAKVLVACKESKLI